MTESKKIIKIEIILGDITKIKSDAIVNAANSEMLSGGGVDGAIRNAAGPKLLEECIQLKKEKIPHGLGIGEVIITRAYNLPAKIIIHTVGPRYYKENITLLKKCYINSLKIAEENKCRSISFPAISTGAYGCPIEKSAEIVKEMLNNFESKIIQEIKLVLYNKKDFDIYSKIIHNEI